MSRSNAAIAQQPEARSPRTHRIRVTVGDLVAAAYDVAGERARPAEVARLLRAVAGEAVELKDGV